MPHTPADPLRIGPQRDRRRHKRVMTLKNGGWFLLAVAVVFGLLQIGSEFRKPAEGNFGALYQKRTAPVEPATRRPIEIVSEQPVPEQKGIDPLLLDGVNRSMYLGAPTLDAPRLLASTTSPELDGATSIPGPLLQERSPLATAAKKRSGESRFKIEGGATGVTLSTQ